MARKGAGYGGIGRGGFRALAEQGPVPPSPAEPTSSRKMAIITIGHMLPSHPNGAEEATMGLYVRRKGCGNGSQMTRIIHSDMRHG